TSLQSRPSTLTPCLAPQLVRRDLPRGNAAHLVISSSAAEKVLVVVEAKAASSTGGDRGRDVRSGTDTVSAVHTSGGRAEERKGRSGAAAASNIRSPAPTDPVSAKC